jgi:hypothetical protein
MRLRARAAFLCVSAISLCSSVYSCSGADDANTAPVCPLDGGLAACGDSGICRGGGCATCIDPTDDPACTSTYGAQEICLLGACVPGCRTDRNCVGNDAGPFCGPSTHQCSGMCSTSDECDAGLICENVNPDGGTPAGACVSPKGLCNGSDSRCPVNTAYLCCNNNCEFPVTYADGGAACCGSAAASDDYCKAHLSDISAVCFGNVCVP